MNGARRGALPFTILLGLVACQAKKDGTSGPTDSKGESTVGQAPVGKFEITSDLAPSPGKPGPKPPAAALVDWRVWVNQEQPRQKKNPEWKIVPAQSPSEPELPADNRFRCVLTPATVHSHMESETEVQFWTASRAIRCSSDGWRTFVATRLVVDVSPKGDVLLPPDPHPSLALHDQVAGKDRETAVALAFDTAEPARDAGAAGQAPSNNATDAGKADSGSKRTVD